MKFAYARTGGPLLNWSGPTPPSPTRSGESRALGCCGLGEFAVPLPGAPEMVAGYMPEGAVRTISGYIPEGAARTYGTTTIGDAAAPSQALMDVIEGPGNMIASLAMVYHGYKRNNGSILWAILWGFTGMFGVPFALAQGFGKPKLTSNPAKRRRRMAKKKRAVPRRKRRATGTRTRRRGRARRKRLMSALWRSRRRRLVSRR